MSQQLGNEVERQGKQPSQLYYSQDSMYSTSHCGPFPVQTLIMHSTTTKATRDINTATNYTAHYGWPCPMPRALFPDTKWYIEVCIATDTTKGPSLETSVHASTQETAQLCEEQ